jgi:hypothetical protein
MDFENELAEMDKNEYRKLKRAITRDKSRLKGLSEKEKTKLLAGWIDDIKEERKKKAEEPEEKEEGYPWQEVEIESEKGEKIEEIKSQIFADKKAVKEAEIMEDESEEKRSPWKWIIAAVILLLLIAGCVFGILFLLKESGNVKFEKISDVKAKEGEPINIELRTKNADSIDVYGLPEGASFRNTTFLWIPSFDQAGVYNIRAVAYNNQSNKTREFSITVINVNRAPNITYTSPADSIKAYANRNVPFTVTAEDKDNENLTYTWNFGLFDSYSGKSAINRTFTATGDKNVKVKVCDKKDCVSHEWKVKVVNYVQPKSTARSVILSQKLWIKQPESVTARISSQIMRYMIMRAKL